MARSRSRFASVSALFVVTLLLVVLPTLGCRAASEDAASLASETPTWEDLGARRLILWGEAQNLGLSPDGRFLYAPWCPDGLIRFETAREYSTETESDLCQVSDLNLGRSQPRYPVVSPDGTRIALGVLPPGEEPGALDPEIWIVDLETGAVLQVVRGVGPNPVGWHADGRGLVVQKDGGGLVSLSLADDTRRVLGPPPFETAGTMPNRVSPDGRFVAYPSRPFERAPESQMDIHVAAVDGSWRGPLVEAEGVQQYPVWTPDGTMLLYFSLQRGRRELWGVEVVDGRAVGSPRVLVSDPCLDGLIGMGANGTLVFLHNCRRSDVYTVEIDPETHEFQSEPVSVFGGENLPNRAGIISPDGTLMAFITQSRQHPRGVPSFRLNGWFPAIRDLTTGTDRVLDTPLELAGVFYMPPMWSPDGRYLLFPMQPRLRAYVSPGDPRALYLYDVVTGDQRWLLGDAVPSESVAAYGWLPDGHTVVYGVSSPTETGVMLSVRRHDVATGLDHELWKGPVGFRQQLYSSHLSPDGRYVTLPEGEYRTGQALWVLDLELGELRELARSPNGYMSVDEPFLTFNQWTNSGTEIIASGFDNSQWRVNAYPDETTFWAIPLTGGEPRKLGTVHMDLGGEWFGGRYFSLHPNSDALTFTGGGVHREAWVAPDFDKVLDQWKKAKQ